MGCGCLKSRKGGFGANAERARQQQNLKACDYGDADPGLVRALESARKRGLRIRIRYPWHKDLPPGARVHGPETEGYVACTQGWGYQPVRAPMFLSSQRAISGGTISLGNVVEVRCANRRECGVLWRKG